MLIIQRSQLGLLDLLQEGVSFMIYGDMAKICHTSASHEFKDLVFPIPTIFIEDLT